MRDSAKLVWWKGSGTDSAMSGQLLGRVPPCVQARPRTCHAAWARLKWRGGASNGERQQHMPGQVLGRVPPCM